MFQIPLTDDVFNGKIVDVVVDSHCGRHVGCDDEDDDSDCGRGVSATTTTTTSTTVHDYVR